MSAEGPKSRISERVESIQPSAIRKFFDLANEMKGQVISLSIGEPDFVTPWSIREAGIYSLEKGYTHYSPNTGYKILRKEIASYMKQRFSLVYNPDHEILVTVGGSEAIDLAFRTLLNPGDEVIIPEPSFVAYNSLATLTGAVPVPIATKPEEDFRLTAAALEAAITEKSKLLVLAYPNNPTGGTMSRQDLEALLPILEEHPDLLIVSDELYAELTYSDVPHCSIASLPGMWERTIIIGGFSKAFAMTGWRIGFALAPQDLIAGMNKIHQYGIMSAPTAAQYAGITALREGLDDVADMRDAYNQRRRVLIRRLNKIGLPCFNAQGAFYAFPDIRSTGLTSNQFCEKLLEEEKVAIIPGVAFGACGEGFVRISYAASIDNIEEALVRLERFVNKYRK
ncbi:MAG: aminotransferase class I/II-fold pyridoxal phosphate-dependent enzyme [Clostridia bacterium]|nr:aminotransferase class I/II-fold pyridoxal phosphate-dependent enzyme [Clostridia bacterium]